jgi:CheY-like chemotaxis protein
MTILVVEDDRSFRKGLTFELQDAGYQVTEAENGKQAIELINKNSFDLVVSDLVMPEADGLEIFEQLGTTSPDTKFILLTAFIDNDRAKLAQKILKECVIEKSIGHEQVIQKIFNMFN